MIPKEILTVTSRDGLSQPIHVVEIGFADFLEHCTGNIFDAQLAEASVRLANLDNKFERRAPKDWLKTLDDDSVEAVLMASNKLNISPVRAKKAAALSEDWLNRVGAQSQSPGKKSSQPGEEPSSNSQPTATAFPPHLTTREVSLTP